MKCPHCKKEIPDTEIKQHSASLAGKKSKRTISPEAQAKMQASRKKRGLTAARKAEKGAGE